MGFFRKPDNLPVICLTVRNHAIKISLIIVYIHTRTDHTYTLAGLCVINCGVAKRQWKIVHASRLPEFGTDIMWQKMSLAYTRKR